MDMQEREKLLEAKQCLGCMHEGMLVTGLDGTIIETTPAAERILETPSVGLKGQKIEQFCCNRDMYEDIRNQAAHETRAINRSLLVSAGAGKRKLVNMSMQRFGDGEKGRLIHVFQDCADLRTLEERLLQSERLATVGRFASQIAHEIRNPLNSISLNIELLEDELHNSNDEARSLIRSVLRELDRLNDIVSEYLQFSRFPKPHLKRGRIEGVIQGLADSFRPPQNITFRVQLAPETPEIWLDEALLRQVLDNLMRNAVEAINGKSGVIEVETDVLDRFLAIRVRDNGIGIPADVQSKLFEPFFTTKVHGTGLGLATSQQIIFEHNGHLLVESQPAKGATFSVLLPI
jgi:signal transduction histidine kinase